jgi:hypothetical protein
LFCKIYVNACGFLFLIDYCFLFFNCRIGQSLQQKLERIASQDVFILKNVFDKLQCPSETMLRHFLCAFDGGGGGGGSVECHEFTRLPQPSTLAEGLYCNVGGHITAIIVNTTIVHDEGRMSIDVLSQFPSLQHLVIKNQPTLRSSGHLQLPAGIKSIHIENTSFNGLLSIGSFPNLESIIVKNK